MVRRYPVDRAGRVDKVDRAGRVSKVTRTVLEDSFNSYTITNNASI